ncbi:MAG: LemA family protein [Erysipelotrichaceae bacterium]|nr:LemA family protein [Erysipelotrichaceae bacterium]
MDALMLILLGMMIVICLLIGIYTTLYNKLQDYVIRINEVEAIIDNNLRDKYDNINKCVSLIKGNEKINEELDKKMFEEIVRLRTRKISNFDLDRKLIEANNKFITLKEKYKELRENEEIIAITKKIDDLDETLLVNREYYNKNIATYNKLVKLFPTNIVAKLCKYEEKLFFDRKDMSDDDFNDFKF